jgi:hypothetical protein
VNGHDYVATQTLFTKQGQTLAEVGARCDRVPASSLRWLLTRGAIALDVPPRRVRPADAQPQAAQGSRPQED